MEVGQTGEIMARLEGERIPAEVRTTPQESGLQMCEILVADDYYDRGCDLVEAWYSEQLEAQKKQSGVYCKKCGSRDYDRNWDEKIGYVYKCKKCGNEFVQ